MKIRNTFDAYWFLYDHPKFRYKHAELISKKYAKTLELADDEKIVPIQDLYTQKNSKKYCLRLIGSKCISVLDTGLSIFYTKVNKRKRVDGDKSKNKHIECWLEYGPLHTYVQDGNLRREPSHDYELDCGAPTFDKALVKLAKLVKKKYGDYKKTRNM